LAERKRVGKIDGTRDAWTGNIDFRASDMRAMLYEKSWAHTVHRQELSAEDDTI